MIDYNLISLLSPELNNILQLELNAGNIIYETASGGFANCTDDHIFIWLKYPFKTEIKNDLIDVVYREINDRHYWKAEYNDVKNHQTLACLY